ncbi:hypothetical protein M0R45_001537 [Rubus argutus]|uniref:Legume lectin domain-containing protein n=1 Tax=Rubus argutus TaxID=59490 RepID=A0AAW1VKK3_RUBAR
MIFLRRLSSIRLHYYNNSFIIIHLINFLLIPFCHPLSFSINHFAQGTSNILYEGDAVPSIFKGSEVIELNTQFFFCVGRATYAIPLHLWEGSLAADFTTNFSFIVDTLNNQRNNTADGFAFFLAPVHFPIPPNPAGAYLGLLNRTTGYPTSQNQLVMVEFDSYANGNIDPPWPHIGINDKTISSVVHASWDPVLHSGKEGRAQITYNATTNNLSVFWTYEESFAANNSLSLIIDLRKSLPEWVTIGFSSSTGLVYERHIISSWEFSSDLKSDESKSKKKEKRIVLKIVIATVVPFFILMLCIYLWAVIRKWIKRSHGTENNSGVALPSINKDLQMLALPRQFTYHELFTATNNFANDRRRTYHDGEFHLPLFRWVWHLYLEGNLLDAADERLEMDFDHTEMEYLLIMGLWCTHLHPRERPKAGQVIKVLQLEAPLPKLPHIMPEYPMPQPQTGSSQSQLSFTSSFNTIGR